MLLTYRYPGPEPAATGLPEESRFLSIRARLLLLILFATLIPALVGGLNFLDDRESRIADAKRELANATRQVAQALTDTVRSTAQLHYGLSRARDFDTQDRNACSTL